MNCLYVSIRIPSLHLSLLLDFENVAEVEIKSFWCLAVFNAGMPSHRNRHQAKSSYEQYKNSLNPNNQEQSTFIHQEQLWFDCTCTILFPTISAIDHISKHLGPSISYHTPMITFGSRAKRA